MSTSLAEQTAAASARKAATKPCRHPSIYAHLYVESIDSIIRSVEYEPVSTLLLHYEKLPPAIGDHAHGAPFRYGRRGLLRRRRCRLVLARYLLRFGRLRMRQKPQHAPHAGADQDQGAGNPNQE